MIKIQLNEAGYFKTQASIYNYLLEGGTIETFENIHTKLISGLLHSIKVGATDDWTACKWDFSIPWRWKPLTRTRIVRFWRCWYLDDNDELDYYEASDSDKESDIEVIEYELLKETSVPI